MNDIGKIGGIPVLMAVAFSSGDGWKDSTTSGQELFVWGVTQAPPYVANSCPRIGRGKYVWSVTPELHAYRFLKEDEFYQLKSFFDGSPALQEEIQIIRSGIESGEFLEIPDLQDFCNRLKSPQEGGIKDKYERLGITTTASVDESPIPDKGGRL